MAKVGTRILSITDKEETLIYSLPDELAAQAHSMRKDNTPAGAEKLTNFLREQVSDETRKDEVAEKLIVHLSRYAAVCRGASVDAVKNITASNAHITNAQRDLLNTFLVEFCQTEEGK
jgi:hypothetical protein